MNRSAARFVAAALLGLGVSAVVAQQRPPLDPLAEARARQQIADQKAETDVLDAVQNAERWAKTNPAKAVQALKAAQTNIDLAVAVSGTTRKNLTDLLQRRIAAIEGKPLPNVAPVGPVLDPKAGAVRNDKKTSFESYSAEIKAVREGIDRFAKYKDAGLDVSADRELAGLARNYPNNPSVILLQEQASLGTRVQDSVDFAKLQSDRVLMAMKAPDIASLPIGGNGDIEFPKDWKEKTARRLKTVELSAEEKKIIESLNKPVTVDWNNRPLDEALQDLSNQLDQKLFLDKKSIEDLAIDLRKPMSLQANGVSARTVLRQMLAAQGLTFVIKDQVIQVVDVDKAKNMLVTRVYYLGDVVQGVGPFGDATKWGPFLDFQQTLANVDTIMATIKKSIDPLCWRENGGPCTVTFHVPSMSIIVRASAEVHATLGTKMGGGR